MCTFPEGSTHTLISSNPKCFCNQSDWYFKFSSGHGSPPILSMAPDIKIFAQWLTASGSFSYCLDSSSKLPSRIAPETPNFPIVITWTYFSKSFYFQTFKVGGKERVEETRFTICFQISAKLLGSLVKGVKKFHYISLWVEEFGCTINCKLVAKQMASSKTKGLWALTLYWYDGLPWKV